MLKQERYLTGLRGLFCILIVLFHYSDASTVFEYPIVAPFKILHNWSVIGNGYLWVNFFYLISGYFLARRYFYQSTKIGFYFTKRIFRIFPLHLFLLSLFLLRNSLEEHYQVNRFGLDSLGFNVLLIQNWVPLLWRSWNYPSWTLSSEWFLYLVFGIVLIFRKKIRTFKHRDFILAALLMLFTFIAPSYLNENTYNLKLLTVDSRFFILGIILAQLPHLKILDLILVRQVFQIGSLAALVWVSGDVSRLPHLAWIFSILILSFRDSQSLVSRFLSNPFFLWFGERSFTLYLCHIPILELFLTYLPPLGPVLGVTASLLFLLGFTFVLHFCFEKKIYGLVGLTKKSA
jgi:peptidoglycan/LPS O-acetylase OafA/YrhL